MKTIISKDEYRRRDREYQKKNYKYDSRLARQRYKAKLKANGKLTKEEELNLQKEKIKSLKEQGFKNKEISQKLNMPLKTLERHITNMKKSRLL